MPSRFKSRQQALQTLYLWDMRRQPVYEIFRDFYGSLASDDDEPAPERDVFGELSACPPLIATSFESLFMR